MRRAFLLVGCGTLAAWLALWVYVVATNRWGVFAVAWALLPLFLLSSVLALAGLVMFLNGVRSGRKDLLIAVLVIVHGGILIFGMTRG
jgi:hypothetical protein